jgi:hypothetical protein
MTSARKALALVALLFALVFVLPATARAQTGDYAPSTFASLVLNKTVVHRQEPFTGTVLPGNIDSQKYAGTINWRGLSDPINFGATTADAAGGGTNAALKWPAGTPLGEHTVQTIGTSQAGTELVLSAKITVITEEVSGAGISRTGSSIVEPLTRAGLVLLVAGGSLVLVARRRRHRRDATA